LYERGETSPRDARSLHDDVETLARDRIPGRLYDIIRVMNADVAKQWASRSDLLD
jgi:hypothetical protein